MNNQNENQTPQTAPAPYKICKHCKSKMPMDAKVCPQCRKKQGIGAGKIVLIVVAVFVVIGIVSSLTSDPDETKTPDNDVQTAVNNPASTPDDPVATALAITDAYISEDVIGTNLINLTVTNSSEYTIDAFDYKVQSYNTYGEKLSNSLFDSFTKTDFELSAGTSCTSSASLYLQDTATSFKVALTRYHIKDTGETVDIPNKERIWFDVQK